MIPTKNHALLLCILATFGISSSALAADYGYYDDDVTLAAPNVSWYAGAQAARNNLHYLGAGTETGFGALFGGYFDDIKLAGLRYGVEFSYQTTGESVDSSSRTLSPGELSNITPPTPPTSGTETSVRKLRVTLLGFGGRVAGDHFFVRFGGSMYSLQGSNGKLYQYTYSVPAPPPPQPPADKTTRSGFAPYLGVGTSIPLMKHLKLTLGYDVSQVDSHRLPSASLGLMYIE